MLRELLWRSRSPGSVEIARGREQEPRRRRQRPPHQRRVGQRVAVRPDRQVIVLADDVDVAVGRVLHDADLRIAVDEGGQDLLYGELGCRNRRGEADRPARLRQALADRPLGRVGPREHGHRVAIEFAAHIRRAEAPGRAIEQPHPEASLQCADAMAQR